MGPTVNDPSIGGGRFMELDYHYNGILWPIIWDRSIYRIGISVELVGLGGLL